MISLPGQIERIQSMSFQFSDGSNCDATQADTEPRSLEPGKWPAMLPKLRLLAPKMPFTQPGLVAMSMMFLSLKISGGTDMPFLMSWWRWPITCRSTVSTSALHLAAMARSISAFTKPRSRIT